MAEVELNIEKIMEEINKTRFFSEYLPPAFCQRADWTHSIWICQKNRTGFLTKTEMLSTCSITFLGLSNCEKMMPEVVAERREEFSDRKPELKGQWEKEHDMPWPKYEQDVYSASGKLIRKAGSDYDAHHIQPLAMGGKNEVENITPLHVDVHYDKQGVHSPDSPYAEIDKILGGADL